jgi:hypothetical protein
MEIFKLLAKQLETLSNTGRTNPEEFRADLMNLSYQDPCATFTATNSKEVDALIQEVHESSESDKLFIPSAGFQFDSASLHRLGTQTWLTDDIVLACLHLSTKLPFIRIGFSVPIHRRTTTRGGSSLPDPFQRASEFISKSRNDQSLVWLFPIFQRNSHFSLLEIDERDSRIYHYDSMNGGVNSDVKVGIDDYF